MSQLVFVNDGKAVTDSLTVAEVFGKEHRRVMQDIRELECSEEFSLHNFVQSNYSNGRGRSYEKFIITQDGFTLLAMGYTGKEAMRFKENYITEFNRMRAGLVTLAPAVPQSLPEALRMAADLAERNEQLRLQAEADRPKIIFAEALETSGSSILIGELAKLLKQNGINIGQNRLFEALRRDGYLGSRGDYRNMPTQRSMDLKLFEIKTRTINNPDGSVRTTRTTKVTGKGQSYFINKYREAVG